MRVNLERVDKQDGYQTNGSPHFTTNKFESFSLCNKNSVGGVDYLSTKLRPWLECKSIGKGMKNREMSCLIEETAGGSTFCDLHKSR